VPGNHDYVWKGNVIRKEAKESWVKYFGSPLGWGKDEIPWMDVESEPKGSDGLGIWKDGNC
jgi:hypothetical protein